MARSKQEWTKAKFERYMKEGRGKGSGKNYQPWIKIQDFASKGRVSRPPGWKTSREHHLFSDNEKRLFYLFEWSDKIIDIREQFPLLDLDLAMNIATEMGYTYPMHNDTPWVFTTDFMLSVKQGKRIVDKARTFKPVKELGKKSVAEKFELEKRYYERQGIDWGIITEKDIPMNLVKNVEWVHSSYKLEANAEMDVDELCEVANILKSKLQESDSTINRITSALDQNMNLETGTSLYLFKHLIANKKIIMDMQTSKISSSISAKEIQRIIF